MRAPLEGLCLSAALLAAACLHAPHARADGAVVAISVDPCVPVDHAALQRILTIELGTSALQKPGGPTSQAPTRVYIGCSAHEIQLRLEDGVTSKVMTRALPAQSFSDPSSTRLLALAVAEFVVASWIELEVQPAPSVPPLPVAPPPSPEALRAVSKKMKELPSHRPPEQASLSLAGSFQLYALQDSPWLGGNVRVLSTIRQMFAWSVSVDLDASRADVSLGHVSSLAASLSAAALFHARLGDVALFTGPAARFGLARLQGVSDDAARSRGEDFFAPFGGPAWLTRFELSPTEVLRLGVEVEVGYVTLPAKATFEGRRVYALDGLWGTTGLSIGIGF